VVPSQELRSTALELVAAGKGVLAADESNPTIGKKFEALSIPPDEAHRRDYREMLLSTPGLEEFISGVILYDETLRQDTSDGTAFPKFVADRGILPGIKVDTGAKPLAGSNEKVTEGLDGLRERLDEYRAMGARFAKWRAVIEIGDGRPSSYCIGANAHALGRYAALCQEAGIVPMVEPEVVMDGTHSIDDCRTVTRDTLHSLFDELHHQRVDLSGLLLKCNMVMSGKDASEQASVQEVAEATVALLKEIVPPAVPGITFLSGGQSEVLASEHLNAMNALDEQPWELSFSYARALQSPALKIWKGEAENVESAQKALFHRAQCNSAARYAKYSSDMEN
jgi:fructose-bisphosphate aldolase class I